MQLFCFKFVDLKIIIYQVIKREGKKLICILMVVQSVSVIKR
jgi:hypothetical protein